jgi:HEAT repeat protein
MHILKTLSVYPTAMAGRVLTAGMSDPEPSVRIVCCKAWGTRGGREAVEPLSNALNNDSNFDVRIAAARGLGKIKDSAAAVPLADALNETDPAMQRRLVESLKSVSGRDYGNDIEAWRQYARSGAAPQDVLAKRPWYRPFF